MTHPKIWLVWTVSLLSVVVGVGCQGVRPVWQALPNRTVPVEQAWRTVHEVASIRYERFSVVDPKKGFLQSDWRIEQVGLQIGAPVERTRLAVWITEKDPVRIVLRVEREAYSLPLGRWWKRNRRDDPVLQEVAAEINARLQRF